MPKLGWPRAYSLVVMPFRLLARGERSWDRTPDMDTLELSPSAHYYLRKKKKRDKKDAKVRLNVFFTWVLSVAIYCV